MEGYRYTLSAEQTARDYVLGKAMPHYMTSEPSAILAGQSQRRRSRPQHRSHTYSPR